VVFVDGVHALRVQSPRKDAGRVRTPDSGRGCVQPRTLHRDEQRGPTAQRHSVKPSYYEGSVKYGPGGVWPGP
jgi:hypothetical protein